MTSKMENPEYLINFICSGGPNTFHAKGKEKPKGAQSGLGESVEYMEKFKREFRAEF